MKLAAQSIAIREPLSVAPASGWKMIATVNA